MIVHNMTTTASRVIFVWITWVMVWIAFLRGMTHAEHRADQGFRGFVDIVDSEFEIGLKGICVMLSYGCFA